MLFIVIFMVVVGYADQFIKEVRSQVTEDTSALFLLTDVATDDRGIDAMKQYDFEIISTAVPAETTLYHHRRLADTAVEEVGTQSPEILICCPA